MKNQSGPRWWWLLIGLLLGLTIAFLGLRFLLTPEEDPTYEPQVGDVLFQPLPPLTDLVAAIEGITGSSYTHCGVVVNREGQWYVIEAGPRVMLTPLMPWIDRGRHNRFAAFRLRPAYRPIIPEFIAALLSYLGLPYDAKYEMGDKAIYCSELIFKAFRDATGEELGRVVRLDDLNWQPYREIILRYEGGPVPLERLMITPKHLADAEQLVKIFEYSK